MLGPFFLSLNRTWNKLPSRIIILCDDTVDPSEVANLTQWVPCIELLNIHGLHQILIKNGLDEILQAKSKFPDIKMIDKLSLLCAFDEENRIYCDLDILWRKCPFTQIPNIDDMAMAEDIKSSYDMVDFPQEDLLSLQSHPALNAGFLYLPSGWYDHADIQSLIRSKNEGVWNHFSEQTIVAMSMWRLMVSGRQVHFLERPWMTFGTEGLVKKHFSGASCIHYTMGSRWDIFPDGYLLYMKAHPFKAIRALFSRS